MGGYNHVALLVIIAAAVVALAWFVKRRSTREKFAVYGEDPPFMGLVNSLNTEDATLAKKYPYPGYGNNLFRMCSKPDNKGCDTFWVSGQLKELTPNLRRHLKKLYT
jgi:hypothetical protein